MGQLHYQKISLEELVQHSNLIVVAIAPPAKGSGRRPAPFEVVEALRDGCAQLGGKVPSRIWPVPAYQEQAKRLRRDAARGLSKHVFRRRYEPSSTLEDLAGKPVILFLGTRGPSDARPAFAALGSYESLEKRDAVVRLIAANPR